MTLDEWMEIKTARGLYEEFSVHAESADPKDFARLAMISVRQWYEDRINPPAEVAREG